MFAKPGAARVKELSQLGAQQFRNERTFEQATLWGFWQWCVLDLNAEGPRRSLAEFLLTHALGLDGTRARQPGLDWDLASEEGIRLKVETAAIPATWGAERTGAIAFPVLPRRAWDAKAVRPALALTRPADVYIFAALKLPGDESPHPLEVQHWSFYLVATRALDAQEANASAITLQSLRSRAGRSKQWRGPVPLHGVKSQLGMLLLGP